MATSSLNTITHKPTYEYLVSGDDVTKPLAEMIPVPMELVSEVEDLLISKGCDYIKTRRDMRPKE